MAASSSPAIRATSVTPASRITRKIVVEERSANAITTWTATTATMRPMT